MTDYARMETADLIARFITQVGLVGSSANEPKLPPRSQEARAIYKDIHIIADELLARKPIADIEPLYDHPDVDVRYWAAGQFHAIDPERAGAVYNAVRENLSTGEVISLVRRAKQKPPKTPALSDMTIAGLVERFEDASMRLYATEFISEKNGIPEAKTYTRIKDELFEISNELETRHALTSLFPMLQHPNRFARHMAATVCLPIAADLAVPVLESIAHNNDPPREGLFASWTLSQWRKKQAESLE